MNFKVNTLHDTDQSDECFNCKPWIIYSFDVLKVKHSFIRYPWNYYIWWRLLHSINAFSSYYFHSN